VAEKNQRQHKNSIDDPKKIISAGKAERPFISKESNAKINGKRED
jgi:hypothetical protein